MCLSFLPRKVGVRMGLVVVWGDTSLFFYRNAQDKYPNGLLLDCAERNPSREETKLCDCYLV